MLFFHVLTFVGFPETEQHYWNHWEVDAYHRKENVCQARVSQLTGHCFKAETLRYHQVIISGEKNKAYFIRVIFMCLSFTVNRAMNKVEDAFLIAKNFIGNTKQKQLPWLPHIFYPHKIQLHIHDMSQTNHRALILSEVFRVGLIKLLHKNNVPI